MAKTKPRTGEEYLEAAFFHLEKENYETSIGSALIAFALGTPAVAMVFCKYYHDKMVNGDVVSTTVPFLIMYDLAKNYRLEGYTKYTEAADTARQIMVNKRSIIERDVAAFETFLYEAGQEHGKKKVTPEAGLKLVDGMQKKIPAGCLESLPLEYLKQSAPSTPFEIGPQPQYYGAIDLGQKAPLIGEHYDNGSKGDLCAKFCNLL